MKMAKKKPKTLNSRDIDVMFLENFIKVKFAKKSPNRDQVKKEKKKEISKPFPTISFKLAT